ncbi:MAG: DUF4097 domain-containing protein [Oscillospiraceae bacterium]|jgi:hypothetical protein|nr:DUF4097 domain-containing protein [Oscillospiraceae bacterium]
MKKNRIWVVALALILVGGIIGAIGYASGASTGIRWDKTGLHTLGNRSDTLEMAESYDIITSITIDHDIGNVTLEPSFDGSFGYSLTYYSTVEPEINYSDGRLNISVKSRTYNGWGFSSFGFNIGQDYSNDLIVYYPEGAEFTSGVIDCGMGRLKLEGAGFGRLRADASMGQIILNDISSGKTEIYSHMGKVELYNVYAGATEITADMGAVDCRDTHLSQRSRITLNMGALNYRGTFGGGADIEANMGAVEIRLDDSLDNYDFDLDCDMGEVRFDGNNKGDDYNERNGTGNLIKIKANMGAITVNR